MNVSNAILILLAVLAGFGALKGLTRGLKRQLVRLVTIIASVAVAVFCTVSASNGMFGAELAGKTVGDMLARFDLSSVSPQIKDLIVSLDAQTFATVAAVPLCVLFLPLFFTLSFILISAIGEIVHIILSWILGFKMSRNNAATRLLGMIVGAAQGVLVAAIIIFPLGCYSNLADGMLTAMDEGGIAEGSAVEGVHTVISDYIAEAKNDKIVSIVMSTAGNKLQDKLCEVSINGEQIDARASLNALMGIYGDYSYLEGADMLSPTNAEKDAINSIKDKIAADEYLASFASGILRELALAVDGGRLQINAEEPYGTMLKDAIAIFESSDSDNIGADLDTILDVYYILADNDVLVTMTENPEATADALGATTASGTVISDIIEALKTNERTKPLVTMLAKLSVTIMADQLGLEGDAAEVYEDVKEGINEVLNIDSSLPDVEYKEAVSDTITDVLADSGITLDESIVDGMADYVTKNFKDNTSLSEDDINDILFSYYDAYINSLS